jgi:hypothetical protein
MTAAARLRPYSRHFSTAYASDGVSPESDRIRREAVDLADASVTRGFDQASLFQKIIDARAQASEANWDGEGAAVVTEKAVAAAIQLLCALPASLPAPEITPEVTGEIAFEWRRDRRHIAVIAVDGEFIRWAALLGPSTRVSGAEPFTKAIPSASLAAALAAMD